VVLDIINCSKAKRLAIGFFKLFLTQHPALHWYSYFYTKKGNR